MTKIEVFFVNGNRAKFDRDKVVFRDKASDGTLSGGINLTRMENGKALVNWAAVSFIRVVEDKEGDE